MNDVITSHHNSRIRYAIGLRDARQRKLEGQTIVDGYRELWLAIQSGAIIRSLFISEDSVPPENRADSSNVSSSLYDQILGEVAPSCVHLISSSVMKKLEFGSRESGVVAVIDTPKWKLDEVAVSGRDLILVLDRVEKPGNLGAIVRTADAAGASAIVLSDAICEPYNPNAIRASLGAVFGMPIASGTASQVIQWLRDHQFQMLAARVDGTQMYSEVDYGASSAIILGSESSGLGQEWFAPDINPIRLPMFGRVDSLNVSVTAGILLYEAARQRSSN